MITETNNNVSSANDSTISNIGSQETNQNDTQETINQDEQTLKFNPAQQKKLEAILAIERTKAKQKAIEEYKNSDEFKQLLEEKKNATKKEEKKIDDEIETKIKSIEENYNTKLTEKDQIYQNLLNEVKTSKLESILLSNGINDEVNTLTGEKDYLKIALTMLKDEFILVDNKLEFKQEKLKITENGLITPTEYIKNWVNTHSAFKKNQAKTTGIDKNINTNNLGKNIEDKTTTKDKLKNLFASL
jgi:hypothetical protein